MLPVTPDDVDALIAENVRATRARRQLRQQDLADEIGWARPTVSSVEMGLRRISFTDAIGLCRALRIDLRELLRGADPEVFEVLGIERRSED